MPTSYMQRGNPLPNECPGYITKPRDDVSPIMELW